MAFCGASACYTLPAASFACGVYQMASSTPRIPRTRTADRKRAAFVLVALNTLCFLSSNLHAQNRAIAPDKIDGLPAFLDATVTTLMGQHHIVGSAVAVAWDGRLVFLKGYGKSRLDTGTTVDPSLTVFRIGSVTKPFTAAAVMQMVESGALDLRRDVRKYLPDVPLRYGANTHQLLTHTSGLDERFAGSYTDSPEHLQRLTEHLQKYTPEQLHSPGNAYSYSNYNYALAGLLVERLSGLRYEQYMAERVFGPLRMIATTAYQPPDANRAADLATSYRWTGTRYEPVSYTYTQPSPSGSMTTTAEDLGRFLLAMLGDGSVDGARVLSPDSVRTLLAPQYSPDARIPATAYGFSYLPSRGQPLLYSGGTLGDQAAMVLLVPAARFGIVVLSNALPGVGDFLYDPLMSHLAGPVIPLPPPIPMADALHRREQFAGTYRRFQQARNEMSRVRTLMPMMQPRVTLGQEGAIEWQGERWLEIEPLVFRSVRSSDHIVFRTNQRGDISELHTRGATYERIPWWEQATFNLAIMTVCLLAFVGYAVSAGFRAVRRRAAFREGKVARRWAVFVALANLAFISGVAVLFRDFGRITPLPLSIVLLLSLPLISLAATLALPYFAMMAWRNEWWTRSRRVGYSIFVACALAFMVFLNHWKLLGFRY